MNYDYLTQKVYHDKTVAECNALFNAYANAYRLCFDRVDAEAVIISRLRNYKSTEGYATVPLSGCDFTGEIGNIIVAISNRCAAAERELAEALAALKAK